MVAARHKKLLRDIWRLKGQLMAIALVVACGIAAFVLSQSAISSLEYARDGYYDRYRLADVFASLKRAPLRVLDRIEKIPGVAVAYPRVMFGVNLSIDGMSEPASGLIISVPEYGESPLNALYMIEGQRPNASDTSGVVISEAFAEAHGFSVGSQFKAVINGRLRTLSVRGVALSPEYVYSLSPGQLFPDNKRFGVMWMNIRALEAATDMDGAFNDLTLSLTKEAKVADVLDALDRILVPYGGRMAISKDDQASYWFVQNELTQLRSMGSAIPVIFLGVAAFLLNIVLARQIATERTQIGMMKAIGYSNWAVGWHYLAFAVVIVLVGALMGAALGGFFGSQLLDMYTIYFRFPSLDYVFDPKTYIVTFIISFLAAVLGTIRAVWGVAKLPPAEAMRAAPPANYQRSLLDRLGLFKPLPTPARMIVRHLERKPLRAIFSVIGISLSAAIFIASMFAINALDYILDVQYSVMNRENVSINFVEDRSLKALDEVTHLPGVLKAEPFRQVPVKLQFETRSEQSVLTAIPSDAQLKRMVNADMQAVTIPDQGLMMSGALAKILGVRLGDVVTAQVLIGRQRLLELPVVGLVEEFMGLSVFTNLSYLNRALGDGAMMSGAALITDRQSNPLLFEKVKAIPLIATTHMKEFVLESVEEAMTASLNQTIIFNTVFAGLIAFGVIYNTARITLSERAREMGSMRVMGFYRQEVSIVILGELTLLVLIGLPIGIFMGIGMSEAIAANLDSELFRLPVIITGGLIANTVMVILAAAILSGIVVWRKLQHLDIIGVLSSGE